MDATAIREVLATRWLARPLHYIPAVDSTSTTLQEMAATGAPAGTMVITDYQRKGRGRLNRRWEAPAGSSLLLSLLLRPGWKAEQAPWLTMVAGLAAVQAVEAQTALAAGLKWPNDVMLQSDAGWRKTGGLLLETEVEDGRLRQAILGVGLNVNIPARQLPEATTPAISLLVASGRPLPRLPLLVAFLRRLEALYEAAAAGESPQPAWNERLIMRDQLVRVDLGDAVLSGVAEGTDAYGRLLLRDDSGVLHTIAAGDVSLRGNLSR
jgi:BirA family biotin operon repressor/biotin-[acetyl-CoA-carboxylase] ligase